MPGLERPEDFAFVVSKTATSPTAYQNQPSHFDIDWIQLKTSLTPLKLKRQFIYLPLSGYYLPVYYFGFRPQPITMILYPRTIVC